MYLFILTIVVWLERDVKGTFECGLVCVEWTLWWALEGKGRAALDIHVA